MFLGIYFFVLFVLLASGFGLSELGKTHKAREIGAFFIIAAVILLIPTTLIV